MWFGVTGPHGTVAHKANLIGNREDIRQSAAELALYYVYTYITEKGEIKIMAVDGRQAALDNALKQIEKDFGKGAIMRLVKQQIA